MNNINLVKFEDDAPDVSETKSLRTITLHDLQAMIIPARVMLLAPIIPAKGLIMAFAQRGIGKTFLGLNIAYAVASGGKFLRWNAPQARPVLYVDGEMPLEALQERVNMLTQSSDRYLPTSEHFRFLALDMQPLGVSLNLALPEHQALLEAQIGNAELIVFDNLSTLVNGGRENDAESWDSMQSWLLRLRRLGKAVLLIHHAGRGENARGTSKREDVLNTVISLKRPANYQPTEGARFEVHLTKTRGIIGDGALPFEAKLETDDGVCKWVASEIMDPEMLQVMELTDDNMSIREIAKTLGMSSSKVQRLQAKGKVQRDGKAAQ